MKHKKHEGLCFKVIVELHAVNFNRNMPIRVTIFNLTYYVVYCKTFNTLVSVSFTSHNSLTIINSYYNDHSNYLVLKITTTVNRIRQTIFNV